MHYDYLPIYKSTLDLCVYVETIVKEFDKYVKYTIGRDLRTHSNSILFGIHKANHAYEKQQWLEKLVEYCEEFKMLVQLAKELKAFKCLTVLICSNFIYGAHKICKELSFTTKNKETT